MSIESSDQRWQELGAVIGSAVERANKDREPDVVKVRFVPQHNAAIVVLEAVVGGHQVFESRLYFTEHQSLNNRINVQFNDEVGGSNHFPPGEASEHVAENVDKLIERALKSVKPQV